MGFYLNKVFIFQLASCFGYRTTTGIKVKAEKFFSIVSYMMSAGLTMTVACGMIAENSTEMILATFVERVVIGQSSVQKAIKTFLPLTFVVLLEVEEVEGEEVGVEEELLLHVVVMEEIPATSVGEKVTLPVNAKTIWMDRFTTGVVTTVIGVDSLVIWLEIVHLIKMPAITVIRKDIWRATVQKKVNVTDARCLVI